MYHDQKERAAKVVAVNRAHAEAKRLAGLMADHFQQFIGKKVIKADGSFLKSVESGMPTLVYNDNLKVYHKSQHHSLRFEIQATEDSGTYNIHYTVSFNAGSVENQVLTNLDQKPAFRSDYTFEEIEAKRKAVKTAEQALKDAQAALWPF